MKRRTLLRRTSALGVFALAGCLSSPDDGGDGDEPGGDPTETPTHTPTETPTGTPTETHAGIAVTDAGVETVRSDCATIDDSTASVTFDGDAPSVGISGTLRTSTPCHEVTVEAAAYDRERDALTVVLGTERESGGCTDCVGEVEFEGTIGLRGGLPGTVYVEYDESVLATATPGGSPAEPTETPEGPPSLQSREFEVAEAGAGGAADEVTVTFEEGATAVVLDGTITGPNGCSTAKLAGANYDPEADELVVDVVSVRREGTEGKACTQVIVGIDYRARFGFAGGLPGRVSVRHDGDGIATAGHGSSSAGGQ